MTNTTIPNSFDTLATGRASSNPFVDEFQSRDPTVNDIQYPIQKKWLNTDSGAFWELQNFLSFNGITTAHWVLIGNQASATETLTTDDAVVVPPTGNNINVLGDGVITTSGNAGTSTVTINAGPTIATEYVCDVGSAVPSLNILNVLGGNGETTTGAGNTITIDYFSLTPYIVGSDANSQYTTIASAVAQAIADGASTANPKNIHIKPKLNGYIENFSMIDGINLVGQGDQVTIHGKISMSTAGEASISNLTLKTNGDYCVSMTGSAASDLTVFNCNIYATDHTAMQQASTNPGSIIPINNCFYFIEAPGITMWDMTSAGFLSQVECSSGNVGASTVASNNSAGAVQLFNCVFDFPVSSSATGSLNLIDGTFITSILNVTAVTLNGTGIASISHCLVSSGTASAVSIGVGVTSVLQFVIASSSNTNVLTGAGTLFYAYISFSGGSSGHNVAVETAIPTL